MLLTMHKSVFFFLSVNLFRLTEKVSNTFLFRFMVHTLSIGASTKMTFFKNVFFSLLFNFRQNIEYTS